LKHTADNAEFLRQVARTTPEFARAA